MLCAEYVGVSLPVHVARFVQIHSVYHLGLLQRARRHIPLARINK